MKTQMTVLAVAATTLGVLAGCNQGATSTAGSTPNDLKTVAASGKSPLITRTFDPSATTTIPGASTAPKPKSSTTTSPAPKSSSSKPASSGAKIVSFKLVQKPKCAEGTAVYRAEAVPAIIKWKITGATGAALSVDDNTHTAGTYGPEPLSGTETFTFQCNGAVGSTEKHTYAIYTVGGGKQHSLTIVASAKVLDKGKL